MFDVDQIYAAVSAKLHYIKGLKDASRQKAILAELRRGIGKKPGELPKLWGFTFQDMPECLMSKSKEPSKAEWAIYTALTLYAYHQQGKDLTDDNMNNEQHRGIGAAVSMLCKDEGDRSRIQNRFNRFATASDMQEATTHLRALIGLLKAEGIGLNYASLAKDLFRYQFYNGAKDVRLEWGRDFYRKNINDNQENKTNE